MPLLDDIRHAGRALHRHARLFGAVVAILGIAIGANSAVFTLVNAVLLSPLPFPDAAAVVAISQTRSDSPTEPLSIPDYQDLRESNRSFENLAAASQWSANVTGGQAERVQGMKATASLFAILRTHAALGRVLLPEDDATAARVVVLTHGFWVRRFGGSPGVLGTSIVLNGDAHTIVGVLPRRFILPVRDADLVAPFPVHSDPRRNLRDSGFLRVIGRLRPGVTPVEAQVDLDAIMARLRIQYPGTNAEHLGTAVVEWRSALSSNRRSLLLGLQLAVGLVLIIACANVANLLLAAAIRRDHEFAVRAALGASRARLIRQVLIEAIAIAAAAAVCGLAIQSVTAEALAVLAPDDLLALSPKAPLNVPVVAFTAGASLVAALLFGVFPALRLGTRSATLRSGRAASPANRGFRDALVTIEVAVASLLITISVLLSQSFFNLLSVEPGFRTDGLLTARLSLPRARYPRAEDSTRFAETLRLRLLALPGVHDAAAVNVVPLNGYHATADVWPADRPPPEAGTRPQAEYRMISPSYVATFGMGLIAGRAFEAADDGSAEPVVLISRTLAVRFWSVSGAVGQSLTISDADSPRRARIVGVVGDVRHYSLDAPPTPDVYVPIPQVPDITVQWLNNNMYWGVRTSGDPAALRDAFREAVRHVDPDVPASAVQTMEERLEGAVAPRRVNLWLVRAFAALALLLAAAGVHAVTAFTVALRRREIAIRTALGARQWQNVRTILVDAVRPALRGLAIGAAGVLAAAPALRAGLFDVEPVAAGTFALVSATLLAAVATAALAAALPVRRIDPVEALQGEAP